MVSRRTVARAALALLGAALVGAVAVRAARAETTLLGQWRAWNLYGGTTSRGEPTCALASNLSGQRMVLIQYIAPEPILQVRLARVGWTIPQGADVRVRTVIGAQSWVARALAGGDEVRWNVTLSTLREWEAAFRFGSVMHVEFLTGAEPPWAISLAGSNAAVGAFASCMRAVGGAPQPHGPTQPFSPGAPPAAPRPEVRT